MKALGLSVALTLLSSALWGDPSASLTVFLPAGSTADLAGSDGHHEVVSGVALACNAGEYNLTVVHPDYEPYSRVVSVGEYEVVLFPKLSLSASYRSEQVGILKEQKQKAIDTRNGVLTAAALTGVGALASWGTVAGLEWSLAGKKKELGRAQERYQAASSEDATIRWAGVQSLIDEIKTLRKYETYALASSSGLTLSGLALLFVGPDPRDWNSSIREMEGSIE